MFSFPKRLIWILKKNMMRSSAGAEELGHVNFNVDFPTTFGMLEIRINKIWQIWVSICFKVLGTSKNMLPKCRLYMDFSSPMDGTKLCHESTPEGCKHHHLGACWMVCLTANKNITPTTTDTTISLMSDHLSHEKKNLLLSIESWLFFF